MKREQCGKECLTRKGDAMVARGRGWVETARTYVAGGRPQRLVMTDGVPFLAPGLRDLDG